MWRSFPNTINPKLWIDNKSNLKVAFGLYNPYSLKGRLVKRLVSILPAFAGNLFLKPVNQTSLENEFNSYKRYIDNILSIDSAINISPGTKSKHQKKSVQIINNKRIEYYLKISNNKETIELSKNEYSILSLLSSKQLTTLTPKAVFGDFIESSYYLIQSAAPNEFYQSETAFLSEHNKCIIELYDLHHKETDIQEYIASIKNYITRYNYNGKSNILATLDALSEKNKKTKIQLSLTHGDFAPWNILTNYDNELFIYDWEHGSENSPLLFDFFHFHFMTSKLLTNNTAAEIKSYIDNLYLENKYKDIFTHMNISNAEYQLYSKLYLLEIITREIRENDAPSTITASVFNIT